jgi:import inner membrane translocase subunit TIM23
MTSLDSDYLQTGGISTDFTASSKRLAVRPAPKKEDLYLKGYGRQFGEKMTYSLGLSYGLGILAGGTYGFVHGLSKGGATTKLRVNSILNSCSTKGPALANQAAILTMFYVGFNNFFGWIRGEEDIYNSTAAGSIAGALYKSSSGMKSMVRHSVLSGVVFTGLDYAFRNDMI